MEFTKKKPLIGLDIGTHSVKIARLRREPEGYTVTTLDYVPIHKQLTQTEEYSKSAFEAVRDALGKIELDSLEHWVVCSLNGEGVLVRPFELAPLNPNEVQHAIRLEAMQISPFGMDNTNVDHQVLDIKGNGKADSTKEQPLKGVLALGTHEVIRSKGDLARQAGARCVLMDVDGLALLNAAMTLPAINNDQTQAEEAVAVINVGHAYTTVAIGATGIAPFIRDIPFAGRAVRSLLCEQMNWSQEQADAALKEGHTHDADPGHVHRVLDQARTQLTDGIAETLRYYAAQQTERSLHQVRICGGAARIQGLIDHLQQRLSGYTLTLWNPLDSLPCAEKVQEDLDPATHGPSFAVALGLALREL